MSPFPWQGQNLCRQSLSKTIHHKLESCGRVWTQRTNHSLATNRVLPFLPPPTVEKCVCQCSFIFCSFQTPCIFLRFRKKSVLAVCPFPRRFEKQGLFSLGIIGIVSLKLKFKLKHFCSIIYELHSAFDSSYIDTAVKEASRKFSPLSQSHAIRISTETSKPLPVGFGQK